MADATIDAPSLCAAFHRTVTAMPGAVALRTPGGAVEITWAEYGARVRRIAAGLAALGVRRGDTVALMMVNRPEFHFCDTAAIHLGATPFSIYNTSAPDQIAHMVGNAGCQVAICEEQFAPRLSAVLGHSALEHLVVVDGRPEGTLALADVEEQGDPGFAFDAAWQAVGPEDLLTLIYTSGTTGAPKGVEVTHANMLAAMAATNAVLPLGPDDRLVSYLPPAHIVDRLLSHYLPMTVGAQITSVSDMRAVATALPDVRPTAWLAVPRVWEKLQSALESRFELEEDPSRRHAVRRALDVGLRKVRAEQTAIKGQGPGPDQALLDDYAEADANVLSGIRARLGLDQVRWSVIGAAPTTMELREFFGAIGLPIREAWGMSELCSIATANPLERNKLGTVGIALPSVELALAEDGELLCRGPLVMRGYRNDPQQTAEAIDADGWFHTGDVAQIDGEGYVTIVDRKKELIINAAGKNMSPANIETKLKGSSPLIGQAVVFGDGRPCNVALIVLDPDAGGRYAAERGWDDSAPAALAKDDGIRKLLVDAVGHANERLSRVEQIKRFAVLPVDWEPGGTELTPTMKLKRRAISEKYAAEIEALYSEHPQTIEGES